MGTDKELSKLTITSNNGDGIDIYGIMVGLSELIDGETTITLTFSEKDLSKLHQVTQFVKKMLLKVSLACC